MPLESVATTDHLDEDKKKKKKRTQGQRRVKLTNVHLEGIDLSQDYVPNKQ